MKTNSLAVLAAAILGFAYALTASVAQAAVIDADTAAGNIPGAYVTNTVLASTFQPAGSNAIVLGPLNLVIASTNTFAPNITSVILTIAGAEFVTSSTPTFQLSVADGSGAVAGYTPPSNPSILVFTDKIVLQGLDASWKFLELSNITITHAAGLATAGSSILLAGEIKNAAQTFTFENIASRTIYVSTVAPAPLPGALAILGLGLVGLGAVRRRNAA